MEQNKTGKYIKYAIGEIILVIIGILIAVSINGWNENRKLKIEEQSLLIDLKQEITMNLKDLEIVIERNEQSFQGATEMRALFRDREAYNKMPDSVFGSMVSKMNKNYTYDPRNGILNSIISSGQINQLSNKELKYLLASLKEMTIDAFENSMKIESRRDALWYSVYDDARIVVDGKIVGFNIKSFYDSGAFRTLTISLFYSSRKDGLEEEYELKKTLEHIIELIDQGIEK
jgi:hypothetical protein